MADHEADSEADADPADDVQDEGPGRFPEREGPADDGDDGELVGDERRAVVHEALALDERDEAARQAEPLRDRRRGRRIGRRDDRSEDEGAPPTEAGDELVRDHRDDHHGAEHEPDGQERDGECVLAQIAE